MRSRTTTVVATALIAVSAVVLVIGHVLPVVTLDPLGPAGSPYTVLGGALSLIAGGDVLLGLLIVLFSGVFPFAKLALLLALVHADMSARRRRWLLGWLRQLGRWSMLDAFVVVILLGTVRLGVLAEARPEPGVYAFTAAILLSLVSTALVATHLDRSPRAPRGAIPVDVPLAAAGALVCFAVALTLPVVSVERWLLWSNEYSLLSGTLRLVREGEWLLGGVVLVFVVGLPCLDLLLLLAVSLLSWRRPRAPRAAHLHALQEWCMVDVFGLALLIVIAKLSGLASVTLRSGLLALGASLTLAVYAGVRLRMWFREA